MLGVIAPRIAARASKSIGAYGRQYRRDIGWSYGYPNQYSDRICHNGVYPHRILGGVAGVDGDAGGHRLARRISGRHCY